MDVSVCRCIHHTQGFIKDNWGTQLAGWILELIGKKTTVGLRVGSWVVLPSWYPPPIAPRPGSYNPRLPVGGTHPLTCDWQARASGTILKQSSIILGHFGSLTTIAAHLRILQCLHPYQLWQPHQMPHYFNSHTLQSLRPLQSIAPCHILLQTCSSYAYLLNWGGGSLLFFQKPISHYCFGKQSVAPAESRENLPQT